MSVQAYQRASRRLVATDYDGTLTHDAVTTETRNSRTRGDAVARNFIQRSVETRSTNVFRKRTAIRRSGLTLKVGLAAEFGFASAPG